MRYAYNIYEVEFNGQGSVVSQTCVATIYNKQDMRTALHNRLILHPEKRYVVEKEKILKGVWPQWEGYLDRNFVQSTTGYHVFYPGEA